MRWRWNREGVALAAWLLAATPAAAGEAGDAQAGDGPAVPLENLLRVPPGVEAAGVARHGGATRGEWQARFAEARGQLAGAQAALRKAQDELGELSAETNDWQMAAPGLGGLQSGKGDAGPLSYRLHQEIRRQREEIARAESRLQELRVEANLAGVPREWTEPPAAEPGTAAAATQGE